jgi:cell division transport system ATP-binding protein
LRNPLSAFYFSTNFTIFVCLNSTQILSRETVIELRGANVFHSVHAGRRLTRRNYRKCGEGVLSHVDLTVGGGETVYFIGRVGSGKSTLLKTLYAEVPLLEGEGTVAGFDLAALRRRDIPKLRRRLGIVFQDYQLLTDRNVLENLRFVLKATGWRSTGDMLHRIEEVLAKVGLRNKEYKMPFELSGGEQQRLAIARALLNDPALILADEPTGNLDPEAADGVMRLFGEIARGGCAIVMSTHNVANIQQYPSRKIRFNKGRIEELDIDSIFG